MIHPPDISSANLLDSFEIFPPEPPPTAIGHYRCQVLAIQIQFLVTPLKQLGHHSFQIVVGHGLNQVLAVVPLRIQCPSDQR